MDMETLLIQKRWRWLGHVLRKPSEDMTKVALRRTPEGKRKRGRPKITWRHIQMLPNLMNADLAFPIPTFISLSAPPSVVIQLPM
jgi:hypothetical protein